MIFKRILLVTFLLFFIIVPTFSEEKASLLNVKEKLAVDKLRTAIGNKLTPEYTKSDLYLIKWVKAKNFNHDEALKALEKALAWRKSANIDDLPSENFRSELLKKYVLDFSVRDRQGNPVVLFPFGDWDVHRKAIEGTVLSDLGRRLDYLEENAQQLAFNLTGDPTTIVIVDINGFSLRKQACAGCLPIYANWARKHELYYPYSFYKILSINTPLIFHPIVDILRSFMIQATKDAFKVYGYDRAEWANDIEASVDLSKLPIRFGGTKKQKV